MDSTQVTPEPREQRPSELDALLTEDRDLVRYCLGCRMEVERLDGLWPSEAWQTVIALIEAIERDPSVRDPGLSALLNEEAAPHSKVLIKLVRDFNRRFSQKRGLLIRAARYCQKLAESDED